MKYSYCTDFNEMNHSDKNFYYNGMICFCLSAIKTSDYPENYKDKIKIFLSEYTVINPYC